MTIFIIKGERLYPTDNASFNTIPELKPRNYVVQFCMDTGFYLKEAAPFRNPSKIYGNVLEQTQRFVTTFMDRTKNTGILLAGDKGSGKTLLSREVCMYAAKHFDVPTIIVNEGYHGNGFNDFISQIDQKCIIMMDEFEKTYRREGDGDAQEKVLTLFDGTISSNKMYLLTVNDTTKVSQHMTNRPGRIYYRIDFGTLHSSVMKDYVADNLTDKSKVKSVIVELGKFETLNFDMMSSLVEEINRYGGTVKEAISIMNIHKETSYRRYMVELYKGNKQIIFKEDLQDFWYDFEDGDDDKVHVPVYVKISSLLGKDVSERYNENRLSKTKPKPKSLSVSEHAETMSSASELMYPDAYVKSSDIDNDDDDVIKLLHKELSEINLTQREQEERIVLACRWSEYVDEESNASRYVFMDEEKDLKIVLSYNKPRSYGTVFR